MDGKNFDTSLLRLVAAELHFLTAMTASHDMFGKSYFSLSVAEKATLEDAIFQAVHSNFQNTPPDSPKSQTD